ncbi:DoxX-like family protein [Bacillus ndiopicus]|uniref:DoxX-like family protein n=1 Tax=Bacillus ndiopicus TaxID=1347368 RepID=UPI0005A61560|nr:DoxX-like family protein [Bacillus ndiopicus]
MKHKPIYVEIVMDTSMERLWEYTQNPALHAQWDLRFSDIQYRPKESEDAPQLFTYKTKVAPFLTVEGWGESKGTHHKKDGTRTSSLHFGTEQKISPIMEGKGFWQYVPNGEALTFLTQYDYKVRYGKLGQALDFVFRPVMGWATALSFDVLRRWLKTGEVPKMQYRRFFLSILIAFTFFFIWFYQGLIPKLIGLHPEEVALFTALSGVDGMSAQSAVRIIGVIEMLFGIIWLLPINKSRLYLAQIVLFPLLTIGAGFASSEVFIGPFNVLTFNLALIVLSIVGYVCQQNCPTAKSCKRRREG